ARGGSGVYLLAGGSITNQSGGTISGYNGVISRYGTAAVVKAGDIVGHSPTAGIGVWIRDGGSVTNQSGGTISGFTGVAFTGAVSGTLVDSGTIVGTGGTAIAFGAS